jgi:hypothetical protein
MHPEKNGYYWMKEGKAHPQIVLVFDGTLTYIGQDEEIPLDEFANCLWVGPLRIPKILAERLERPRRAR